MAISWAPRGRSCRLSLGAPGSWWGLSGEPGMRAPTPTREKGYGEKQALHPWTLFQSWARFSRCQPGNPTCQALPGGAGYSLRGKSSHIPGLARPVQPPPHFPVLTSPPRARLGHTRPQLGHGSRLPTRVAGTRVWRASHSWPLRPPLLASWHKNNNIL